MNGIKSSIARLFCFFAILISGSPIGWSQTSNSSDKPMIICLDAGHGGHDAGAIGRRSKEKDLNLDVVLSLGKRLEAELPNVKVIYTRSTDVFVELRQRAAFANRNHADLFISVHCNSADSDVRRRNRQGRMVTTVQRRPSVKGTETFVLGFDRLADQDVAIRENASILLEENYQDHYDGFDPNDPSSYLVFKLIKRQYRNQSIRLAAAMQKEFTAANRVNRGVKEGPFAVLRTAGMPAVLTEIGFISSPDEENHMLSADGKAEIVNNLFQAIKSYKNSVGN